MKNRQEKAREKFGNTNVFTEFENDPNFAQMCERLLMCVDCSHSNRIATAINNRMVDSKEEYGQAVEAGHIVEYPSGIVQIWA